MLIGGSDVAEGEPRSYVMLNNVSAAGEGPRTTIRGSSGTFSAELGSGGTLNGATVALKRVTRAGGLADLTTPVSFTTLPNQANILVGNGAVLVAVVTGGPPTGLYADLSEVR